MTLQLQHETRGALFSRCYEYCDTYLIWANDGYTQELDSVSIATTVSRIRTVRPGTGSVVRPECHTSFEFGEHSLLVASGVCAPQTWRILIRDTTEHITQNPNMGKTKKPRAFLQVSESEGLKPNDDCKQVISRIKKERPESKNAVMLVTHPSELAPAVRDPVSPWRNGP